MLRFSKRRLRHKAKALEALSMYDPVHLGIDEGGRPVEVGLAYHNMLLGGEPGPASRRRSTTSSRTPPSPWIAGWC